MTFKAHFSYSGSFSEFNISEIMAFSRMYLGNNNHAWIVILTAVSELEDLSKSLAVAYVTRVDKWNQSGTNCFMYLRRFDRGTLLTKQCGSGGNDNVA